MPKPTKAQKAHQTSRTILIVLLLGGAVAVDSHYGVSSYVFDALNIGSLPDSVEPN